MIQEFKPVVLGKFSPNLQVVSQIGAIDLRLAYSNSVVPGNIEEVESNYNGIDEPSSIAGRPDDIFAAKRAAESYKGITKVAPSDGGSAPSEV